jgi:hypothetical protein
LKELIVQLEVEMIEIAPRREHRAGVEARTAILTVLRARTRHAAGVLRAATRASIRSAASRSPSERTAAAGATTPCARATSGAARAVAAHDAIVATPIAIPSAITLLRGARMGRENRECDPKERTQS